MTMEKVLLQAFRKLKSHLFNDKTLLHEKIELARFEFNLEENINNLIKSFDNNEYKYIDKIDYILVPKKIKLKDTKQNVYSNKTQYDKYEVESYNIFIKAPIEVHLISTLWTMTVGEQLDKKVVKESKGNRLFRDNNDNFLNENYKLFRPYYEGYQSFRNKAIDMAISLHDKKLDVTFLNLDIQEFYYNIDFKFEEIKNIKDSYNLNSIMQRIHDQFHKKVKDLIPSKNIKENEYNKFLPIGLVSSAIIANYILNEFDYDIIQNVKPEYYGRYVDDMILVFSNINIDINSNTILCDLLKCKDIKTRFACSKNPNYFTTNKRKFNIQNEKMKIFQFDKDDSIIVLEKFKETIDKNSSFFNFMPDDEKLFNTLESSGNMLFYNNSKNKISSLIGTVKDTLKISRNLTGVISTVSNATFDKDHYNEYNQQLQNIFKGINIFELRLHWEKIFEYLYITNSTKLFEYMFIEFKSTINNLEHLKQSNQLKTDTIQYLENCIKFAIASKYTYAETKIFESLTENDMFSLIDIDDDTKLIRKFNMFSHHNMSYPLLNFCKDTDKLDFLTHNISFGNFYFKIDLKKVKYSPRFFHYHEIALFYFFKQVNGKLKGCEKKLYKLDFTRFLKNRYKKFNSLKICNNLPYIEDKTFIINSDDKTEIKDNLKIAIVSIKVESDDIEKSYTTKPNLSYKRLQNIFDILNESLKKKEHKPDLIVFPEVSIPYAWIHLMARFAKKNNIGIIFGVEHIKIDKLVSNYTCIMLPFKAGKQTNLFVNFDLKRHYSPAEQMGIEGIGLEVNENIQDNKAMSPILYKWSGFVFTTFNCYELTDVSLRSDLTGKIDFIIAIEYNKDTNYFSNIIESTSRDVHCYVIQVNTSDYGDSRIVQPTKTASKDIIKIKGGENLYLAVNDIEIKKLRKFQMKNHCLQKQEKKDSFKPTPPKFKISQFRMV